MRYYIKFAIVLGALIVCGLLLFKLINYTTKNVTSEDFRVPIERINKAYDAPLP